MKHTPEPWHQHTSEGKTYASIRSARGVMSIDCGSRPDQTAQANAARIVATINACAGIVDPAAALTAAREALKRLLEVCEVGEGADMYAQKQARDALKLLSPTNHHLTKT